jgi:tRNA 2-thiocytidine biosynthesis protein TtcA
MPAKLVSDDGRHVVIRPLAYVAEADLTRWAEQRRFPIIPCTLCGSQVNLQRAQVKQMINDWELRFPGRIDNMLGAMGRVNLSHLMDRQLYPFTSLQADGRSDPAGDKAFDDDDDCAAPATSRAATGLAEAVVQMMFSEPAPTASVESSDVEVWR